jgi:hypothetical protein
MKIGLILGIILAAVGTFIVARGLSFDEKHEVANIGGISASVNERHTLPPWVGGALLVGGLAIAAASTLGGRKAG